MKCNQCEMLQITTGGISLPCHEIGCPNAHKVWNENDQEWVDPEPEEDEEEYNPGIECDGCGNVFHRYIISETDDGNFCEHCYEPEYQDEDRGGTGHGDISYSDADPGL